MRRGAGRLHGGKIAAGAGAPQYVGSGLRPARGGGTFATRTEASGLEEEPMVAGVVLIRAQRDHIPTAARAVADIEGVAEVYSVSGEWDLVAIIRVPEWEKIADVVTEKLARVEGLERTMTLVAFRVFSKQDLAGAFDVFE
jgi:DNA-binding Lrp family transcriptional regulator